MGEMSNTRSSVAGDVGEGDGAAVVVYVTLADDDTPVVGSPRMRAKDRDEAAWLGEGEERIVQQRGEEEDVTNLPHLNRISSPRFGGAVKEVQMSSLELAETARFSSLPVAPVLLRSLSFLAFTIFRAEGENKGTGENQTKGFS
uniref:Uncharacterized protein n=1 Tax=Oryza brachyantha TaxID=4533 RepID=J3N1I9_ORYBR